MNDVSANASVNVSLSRDQVDLLMCALKAWEQRMAQFGSQISYQNRGVVIAIDYCARRCDEVREVLKAALAAQPSTPAEDGKV